jgi:hypothetical protein
MMRAARQPAGFLCFVLGAVVSAATMQLLPTQAGDSGAPRTTLGRSSVSLVQCYICIYVSMHVYVIYVCTYIHKHIYMYTYNIVCL